jgi:uncharacterized membrane protein YfcA
VVWLFAYLGIGLFIGFVAGLFGIGGGTTQVPLLSMIFHAQGFSETHLMHLALGSSMASIAFTSIASMRAHHSHGAVRWDIVKSMAPGLVIGTLSGSSFATYIPTRPLAVIFTVFIYYAASQMIFDFKPKPSRTLPRPGGLFLAGLVIGIISSLVAAGGGFLSIPFMMSCNVVIHQAVGTSAALGLPIALGGLTGYVISGWHAEGLPKFSLGYVYLPALGAIVAMSVMVAPLGARLAHKLPVRQLKRAFGVFLALLATKMLYSLF